MLKNEFNDKVIIILNIIEDGINQINKALITNPDLLMAEKAPEIQAFINNYKASNRIEILEQLRNIFLSSNQNPEGAQWRNTIFSCQIMINNKTTDLRNIGGKLDELLNIYNRSLLE